MPVVVDLYCRVSTKEQAEEGYSIDEQERRLKLFADANNWIVNKTLIDAGYSGASMKRVGLQQLIEDCENRIINKVVVFKLDRLSRRQKDTLYLIEDVFSKNGVDFVSMNESLDTSTAFGMAMIGILSVFAQLERETIKERMKIGRDAMVKSGKFHGGGNIPIGLIYENKQLRLHEYDASIINWIFNQYAAGETSSGIAKTLNTVYHWRKATWTSEKVKKLLTNPIYTGYQRWNGEIIKVDNCPIIINQSLFDAVQNEIARRNNKQEKADSPYKHTTLLGGLLFCGDCGKRFCGCSDKTKNGRIYRYYCYGRIMKNHRMNVDIQCENRSWRADQLDTIVINEIKKLRIRDPITESEPQIDSKRIDIEKQIKSIDNQLERLIDLYAIGKLPIKMLNTKTESLQEEKQRLQDILKSENKNSGGLLRAQAEEKIETFSQIVDNVTDKMQLYGIVHQLIKSITLTGEEIKIEWNFDA